MLTPGDLLRQKVKPRWLPMEGNFGRQFQPSSRSCTSVPVLHTTLIFSFCMARLRKHSQPWKKCTDEVLLDQFDIFECLKGFVIAGWPKNCPKLSKDGKLTVRKKDVDLVLSSSNISTPFYQVSRQFGNLFLWKYITWNSVWLCRNIFKILKLIFIFWRYVLYVFPIRKIFRKSKRSHGRLRLTYKPAKGTETDVQSCPPWAAILASLFIGQLAFQIWKSSPLPANWPTCRPPCWLQNTVCRYSSSLFRVQWWDQGVRLHGEFQLKVAVKPS